MKKSISYLLVLVFATLLIGCATHVPIQYMVPADDNMSAFRDLAIAGVDPYRFSMLYGPSTTVPDLSGTFPLRVYSGYQPFSERLLANHATGTLLESLDSTGYFKLLPPSETDRYNGGSASLYALGYDAMLVVEFERLDVEEYVYARKVAVEDDVATEVVETEALVYYLRQKVFVSLSYEVIDNSSGQCRYSRTFQDRSERTFSLGPEDSAVIFAPSMTPILLDMVEQIVLDMTEALAPRWVQSNVALMKNRPTASSVEDAYEAVVQGRIAYAYQAFLREWQQSGHVPSGYNAALLAESSGRRDEAIELMGEVFHSSGNSKAKRQLDRMRRYQSDHALASAQF
ncbi:MAG: hypothetical protein AB7S52_00865 [Sphaerochaetaceae bacterium]